MNLAQATQKKREIAKAQTRNFVASEFTACGEAISLTWLKVEYSEYLNSLDLVYEPLTKSYQVVQGGKIISA